MAVKTVLEVPIDDAAFRRFIDLYNQFKGGLKDLPDSWAKVNDEIKQSEVAFTAVLGGMFAMTETLKDAIVNQRAYRSEVEKSGGAWTSIAGATKRVSENILSATTTLLRWASIGGAVSGLLGIGGLFGLDRLAASAGNTRRAAQGLGATYGEQQAFGLNFGRYVDTDSLVGGINQALTDPAKRFGLIGLGASQQDVASGDAIRIAASVLPNLKKLADQTPTEFLEPTLQSRGLGGVVSADTLRRLKAISPQELGAAEGQYQTDAQRLNVPDPTARAWQDLSRQLGDAGKQIETVFVTGLEPLVGPLKELSQAFSDIVAQFLKVAKDSGWVDAISSGLEEFAKYIGTDDFKQGVKTFAEDIVAIAHAVATGLKFFGVIPSTPDPNAPPASTLPPGKDYNFTGPYIGPNLGVDPLHPFGSSGAGGSNNPGNIRNPNGTGFQSFASPDAGVTAIAKQLQIYEDRDHLNTLSEIENKYSPPSENDTARLIREAVANTGFTADQPLDLHDRDTLAKVVSAITKQEGVKSYTPKAVVTILNNTGGNTIVTMSQLPQ